MHVLQLFEKENFGHKGESLFQYQKYIELEWKDKSKYLITKSQGKLIK